MDRCENERVVKQQYQTDANLKARISLHVRFATNPLGFGQWFFDHLPLREECLRILEIGCGTGSLWRSNLERVPKGWKIDLTDGSEGMLNSAREAVKDDARFSFSVMNAEEIDKEANAYDVVIANHMLYHVDNRDKAFEGIRRVLKPGGSFFATTNGEGHISEIWELSNRFKVGWARLGTERFCLENGAEQLAKWFKSVEMERCDNTLHVTDADALIDYICSSRSDAREILKGERLDEMRRVIEDEIAQKGFFFVKPMGGVFVSK